jgi:hypothetical protein
MAALRRIWDVPLLLALIWRLTFAMIKVAVLEIGPVGVVFTRCLIGGALYHTKL